MVDGWWHSHCARFNAAHSVEIEAGTKFVMNPNLYALDRPFVRATSSADASARSHIPAAVLNAAEIPGVPAENSCFAQLLNPKGVDVDYFVSHWWGHPLERTIKALTNFAKAEYKRIGKKSPDEVVVWICLFALNQHKAAEEVGSTPEQGPFNAALAKARFGAIMVLDDRAMPLVRIWCLFEVRRAADFQQTLRLVVDEGDVEQASTEILQAIGRRLRTLRAAKASASNESDKNKIHFRVLDKAWRSMVPTFDFFLQVNDTMT